MLEEKKLNALKIEEIQEDIRKCQIDKFQLSHSIDKHKKDYTNKPDFQENNIKIKKRIRTRFYLDKKLTLK